MTFWEWSTKHRIERCTTPTKRKLAAKFVNAHHSYIQWSDRPSRKMYWLLWENSQLVGVFGLGSAFDKPKAVSIFMKEHNLSFNEVGNNIVYCLFGSDDKNVGTKFLKAIRHDAKKWWDDRYGDTLKALQTFILPPRTGAMYKADNWSQLGMTTGGKTMTVRTLYGEERKAHPEAEVRKFKNGEVKYLLREWTETEPKLIFMRLL